MLAFHPVKTDYFVQYYLSMTHAVAAHNGLGENKIEKKLNMSLTAVLYNSYGEVEHGLWEQ